MCFSYDGKRAFLVLLHFVNKGGQRLFKQFPCRFTGFDITVPPPPGAAAKVIHIQSLSNLLKTLCMIASVSTSPATLIAASYAFFIRAGSLSSISFKTQAASSALKLWINFFISERFNQITPSNTCQRAQCTTLFSFFPVLFFFGSLTAISSCSLYHRRRQTRQECVSASSTMLL